MEKLRVKIHKSQLIQTLLLHNHHLKIVIMHIYNVDKEQVYRDEDEIYLPVEHLK